MFAGVFHNLRWGAAWISAAFLAGCDIPAPVEPTLKPQQRPALVSPAPAAAPQVAQPTSQASARLRSHLNQVQASQLSNGLLRQDGGGPDTPFSAENLARNFEQIAFFNEYDGDFNSTGVPSPLKRWESPVRMEVVFGTGVQPSVRRQDLSAVQQYATRLARVAGHPVSVGGQANFFVVFAGEDDRAAALAQVAPQLPPEIRGSLRLFETMDRNQYCGVIAFPKASNPNVYGTAVAVIRSENPDLFRLSCIHEELAQGLGLANDSPAARPSIFNDDDEFALLTTHDELLLKMLYDKRLRIGINAAEAAPLTRIIARELTGGPL